MSEWNLKGWKRVQWIRKHGIRAWLTWATVDEATGKVPLSKWTRFWRMLLR